MVSGTCVAVAKKARPRCSWRCTPRVGKSASSIVVTLTAASGASRSLRSVAAKVASRTDSNRSPFALTQFDDLKIGSYTGTCFKVGV
jgi:hypothetical protein